MFKRLFAAGVALVTFLTPALAGAAVAFLVDAEWLEEQIEDPGLVLLEVRYHPHRYYTLGHIPGARQVQRFKVEWPEVYDRVVSRRDPSVLLLDVRPADQYSGEKVHHSVLGGHIPGAINLVSQQGTDPSTHKWLSRAEIARLYADIPRDRSIILYCHDGFRSAQAYLQLEYLGYPDVRVLNGGWGYWGNAMTLPVVEGHKPYDKEFEL